MQKIVQIKRWKLRNEKPLWRILIGIEKVLFILSKRNSKLLIIYFFSRTKSFQWLKRLNDSSSTWEFFFRCLFILHELWTRPIFYLFFPKKLYWNLSDNSLYQFIRFIFIYLFLNLPKRNIKKTRNRLF